MTYLSGPQPSLGACTPDVSHSCAPPPFDLNTHRPSDCDDRGRYRNDCSADRDDCHGDPRCSPLQVSGNTVNTGRYTISASTDGGGTLTVKDNETGESFQVWGDPHITTDNGDTTSFQHAPATFDLPDGTRITVDPTDNSGVNYIKNVTITKGNDAVTMTGFQGNLQTQSRPGEGYFLDATTPQGTVLKADHGNIDQLELQNGTRISGNNVPDIDGDAQGAGSPVAQLARTEVATIEEQLAMFTQGIFNI